MKKNLKSIIALAVCIVALLWLILTVFVQTTVSEIVSFELVESKTVEDIYKITYAYQRDGQTLQGSYKTAYNKENIPLVGEQGVCHYLKFPPYSVSNGDAPTPVTPLVLLAIGAIIYVGKLPKFLKKKEKSNES
ncbi:MAG: hypothetical protein IKY33_00390 [Clostridia bacterium]|nr:hypothetical protein [Clostridia bacterium]